MRYSPHHQKGFTLIEIMIFIGLAAGIMFGVASFTTDVASLEDYFGDALAVEEDVQFVLTDMIPEMRAMAQSNVGNYAIEAADASSITFFTDFDQDGTFERVRYFVTGTTLRRGVIEPTGNPLQYIPGNEVVNDTLLNLSSTTLFEYFDNTYTGAQDPLAFPVTVSDIRLIRVTLSVDENPNAPPGPFTLSRQVTIRNLRDNL